MHHQVLKDEFLSMKIDHSNVKWFHNIWETSFRFEINSCGKIVGWKEKGSLACGWELGRKMGCLLKFFLWNFRVFNGNFKSFLNLPKFMKIRTFLKGWTWFFEKYYLVWHNLYFTFLKNRKKCLWKCGVNHCKFNELNKLLNHFLWEFYQRKVHYKNKKWRKVVLFPIKQFPQLCCLIFFKFVCHLNNLQQTKQKKAIYFQLQQKIFIFSSIFY